MIFFKTKKLIELENLIHAVRNSANYVFGIIEKDMKDKISKSEYKECVGCHHIVNKDYLKALDAGSTVDYATDGTPVANISVSYVCARCDASLFTATVHAAVKIPTIISEKKIKKILKGKTMKGKKVTKK